jgi:hypothetical protein
VQKIAVLALELGTILVSSFLAPGCGDGNGGSSGGKDAGLSTGGIDGTGGSPGLGGSPGSASTGGRIGSGGMTGVGGMVGTDAATSVSDSGGVDAGTPSLPACTGFNACGKSIVGTWKLPAKVLCGSKGSATPPPSSCSADNNLADLLQSGTLTFSASGTWVSSMTFKGTETLTYPTSCLSGGATCADRAANNPDAGMVGSCVENTSGVCVCTYALDNMSIGGQGTYTTSGGTLSVVGSDPSSMDYCVQGNTLSMYAVNSSTGDSATQVYERQ